MVNTAFALKFTTPCKLASKCGIYHLCFSFTPSLHFFAPCLHRVNLCKSNFSCSVGETKRRLKGRFNEHRRPILNPTGNYIHTAVSEHFLTSNHSDNHMLFIPIEKLKNGRDSFRKAREAHHIHKAKTIEPQTIDEL